jgi:hypothetical protein
MAHYSIDLPIFGIQSICRFGFLSILATIIIERTDQRLKTFFNLKRKIIILSTYFLLEVLHFTVTFKTSETL